MLTISVVDIVEMMYPNQIFLGNIAFGREGSDSPIFITKWSVPNTPQPTIQDLLNYGDSNYRAIAINVLKNSIPSLLQEKIDSIANEKGYANAVSCASYKDSTNVQWAQEASAFIAWRDWVWSYAYELLVQYEGNQDPLPTTQQVIDGIIPIVWP